VEHDQHAVEHEARDRGSRPGTALVTRLEQAPGDGHVGDVAPVRARPVVRGAARGHARGAATVVAPLLLGAVLLTAWQLAVQNGLVSVFLLPSPSSMLAAFWDALWRQSLLTYVATTLVESLAGCAVGALVALPMGYAIAHGRLLASAIQPYLAASQAIPAIAVAPLIALWLGYGLSPVIALCALIVFFPMVVNTVLGLRTLDRDIIDAARVEGAGRLGLLMHIEFHLALPSLLAGLRTSLTLSITGAVVGEFVVGGPGLGQLLIVQRSYADSAGVFATLLTLALLATTLYALVRLIELRFSYVEGA
jgi:NitT/TauT family transport system permease protein